jgi:hypothetical protein
MLAVLEKRESLAALENAKRERQAEKKEMLAVLGNEKRKRKRDRLLEDDNPWNRGNPEAEMSGLRLNRTSGVASPRGGASYFIFFWWGGAFTIGQEGS